MKLVATVLFDTKNWYIYYLYMTLNYWSNLTRRNIIYFNDYFFYLTRVTYGANQKLKKESFREFKWRSYRDGSTRIVFGVKKEF